MSHDAKTKRSSQEQFTDDEKAFLKTFLLNYNAKVDEIKKIGTGPKGIAGTKGDKKRWVEKNVYPAYCTKFEVDKSDGPNISTLKKKIVRWFHNNAKPDTGTPAPQPPPKPRATNAMNLFAAANKTLITEKMTAKRIEGGLTPQESNFKLYQEVLSEMYYAADPETRLHFEAEAIKHNTKLAEPPSKDEIYANQESIAAQAQVLLQGLSGWGWGQCGDVVFFVQGAYRDQKGKVKTFTTSLSDGPTTIPFPSQVPNFDQLRVSFKEWAKKHLPLPTQAKDVAPTASTSNKLAVTLDTAGRPLLPGADIEDVSPRVAKSLLEKYITAAWNYALPSDVSSTSVPWNVIKESLVASAEMASFQILDPHQMSTDDAYRMYELLHNAQQAEVPSPLQFKITQETVNALSSGDSDEDITEILDMATLPANGGRSPGQQVLVNNGKKQRGKKNAKTQVVDFSPTAFGLPSTRPVNPDGMEKPDDPLSALAAPKPPAPLATIPAPIPHQPATPLPPLSHPALPLKSPRPPPMPTNENTEGVTARAPTDLPMPSSDIGTGMEGTTAQASIIDDSAPPVKRPVGRPKGVKRKGHPAAGNMPEPVAKKAKVSVPTKPRTKKAKVTQPDQPTRRSGRIHEEGYVNTGVSVRKS